MPISETAHVRREREREREKERESTYKIISRQS
jgi:hypothetical protein